MDLTWLIVTVALLVYLTNAPALGNPLRNALKVPQGDEYPTERYTRQTRNGGLCPRSMSSVNCFYSQMYVFMRMHNSESLRDAVELRNIGKRALRPALNPAIPVIADGVNGIRGFERVFPGMNTRAGGESFADQSYQLGGPDFKTTDGDSLFGEDLYKYVDKRRQELTQTGNMDNSQFSPPSKRQILCPLGMARRECYDNAFAFYLQLLRTVSDQ